MVGKNADHSTRTYGNGVFGLRNAWNSGIFYIQNSWNPDVFHFENSWKNNEFRLFFHIFIVISETPISVEHVICEKPSKMAVFR